MICYQLIGITHLTLEALEHGHMVDDVNTRPGCQLSGESLDYMHAGKDRSLESLLDGGSGFPHCPYSSRVAESTFEMGCSQERNDFRSYRSWDRSYEQCVFDKRRGTVS